MTLRLMITSAGSLLGQNVLDALEDRRDRVQVIGTNLDALNPRLFRCDAAYLTPPTDEADAFRERIREIVAAEDPHLIVAARDHDAVALGEFARACPEHAGKVAGGAPGAAAMMQDKLASHRFAARHGLPFARTVEADDAEAAQRFAEECGFPLLAKPRQGFGSHGVFIVEDFARLERVMGRRGLLLQEHLDPPADLEERFAELELGLPLFLSLPETRQYAAQAIIGPDGALGNVFCSINTMVLGRCERSEAVAEPALADVTVRYAEAVREEGWCGPFNLQAKKLPDGRFVPFEMNPRVSGSTAARRHLGYDELAQLVIAFLGEDLLGDQTATTQPDRVVFKYLTEFSVDRRQVQQLERDGQWRRFS